MYSDASNALPERCDLKLQFTLLPVCPIQQTVAWQLSNNGYGASSPSDVVSRISAFGTRPSNAFDVVGDDKHKKVRLLVRRSILTLGTSGFVWSPATGGYVLDTATRSEGQNRAAN
jgi:hypothetical protein